MEASEQQVPAAEMKRMMRTMRRWREQYKEHGYSGLYDPQAASESESIGRSAPLL